MTCPEFVREALAQFANCFPAGESFAIPTQHLYPSNGVVTVYLTGSARDCIVSDEGRSIMEIGSHGIDVRKPEKFLRQFCVPRGLKTERGKIFSPAVPLEGLPTAISMVATASSLAAHWGVHTLKTQQRRDLHKELRDLLARHFSSDRIREEFRLSGFSGRQYRFEFMVELGHERRLVVDPVTPEAPTINSRAIAHIDIARLQEANLIQRLVYDEAEDWQTSDISLLRMAAELVPLTHFERNIAPLWSQA